MINMTYIILIMMYQPNKRPDIKQAISATLFDPASLGVDVVRAAPMPPPWSRKWPAAR